MAFTWPNNAAGYSASGQKSTTLKWGTQGMFSTAICISSDSADEVERIYLEQGDGLKATSILLKQGRNWHYTIQDDSSAFATAPAIGDDITVTDILGSGSSTIAYTYKAKIVDNNYRGARRQEGQRVIQCESLTLIDTTVAGASPSY